MFAALVGRLPDSIPEFFQVCDCIPLSAVDVDFSVARTSATRFQRLPYRNVMEANVSMEGFTVVACSSATDAYIHHQSVVKRHRH